MVYVGLADESSSERANSLAQFGTRLLHRYEILPRSQRNNPSYTHVMTIEVDRRMLYMGHAGCTHATHEVVRSEILGLATPEAEVLPAAPSSMLPASKPQKRSFSFITVDDDGSTERVTHVCYSCNFANSRIDCTRRPYRLWARHTSTHDCGRKSGRSARNTYDVCRHQQDQSGPAQNSMQFC